MLLLQQEVYLRNEFNHKKCHNFGTKMSRPLDSCAVAVVSMNGIAPGFKKCISRLAFYGFIIKIEQKSDVGFEP